MTDVSTMQERE